MQSAEAERADGSRPANAQRDTRWTVFCSLVSKVTREVKDLVMGEPATVAVPDTAPLLNGSSTANGCVHKNKKSVFCMPEIRKKAKKKGTTCEAPCEQCVRLDVKPVRNAEWMCVACGFYGCGEGGEHAAMHCRAARSGTEHPLFLSVNSNVFRCFSCEIDLEPNDDNTRLKTFLTEFNAFVRQKAKTATDTSAPAEMTESGEEPLDTASDIERPARRRDGKANGTAVVATEGRHDHPDRRHVVVVKGLANLGNTCFFNSIAQCMSHTHLMSLYLDMVSLKEAVSVSPAKAHVADKPVKIPSVSLQLEPFYGPLNDNFGRFYREYRLGPSHTVHPSALFSEIAKKAQRFRGWSQQDAHELLRYLLDGVRTEELNRYKEAISAYLKLPKGVNPKSVDVETITVAKGMLKACGRPLLDAVFGGTLLQTVRCAQCGYLSRTFEEFLDISLPIPSTSSAKFVFNSTARIHKSTSATLSKHQKKKEKANARKRSRRKSLGENSPRLNKEENEVEDEELQEDPSQALPDIDDNEDEEVNGKMKHLELDGDPDECLLLLGEDPAEESTRTLSSCLRAFTTTETLSGPNAYECEKCCLPSNKKLRNGMTKKSVEAEKRYLIYEPPAVLTLHLKRFEQTHSLNGRVTTRKVPGQVNFPTVLDVAPFCTRVAKRVSKGSRQVLYSLYGVVSHSGDLSGGHYVAYVRNRRPSMATESFFYEAAGIPQRADASAPDRGASLPPSTEDEGIGQGEWFFASDSRVSAVSESRVLGAEAYILFYERIR